MQHSDQNLNKEDDALIRQIQEFFDTEFAFRQDMLDFNTYFANVLNDIQKLKPTKLSEEQYQNLEIYLTHYKKLESGVFKPLEKAISSETIENNIDTIVNNLTEIFNTSGEDFSACIKNLEAFNALAEILKKNGINDLVSKNLTINAYSIKPLQRMTRYQLLLRDLIKKLEEAKKSSNDPEKIKKLDESIKKLKIVFGPGEKILDAISESMREKKLSLASEAVKEKEKSLEVYKGKTRHKNRKQKISEISGFLSAIDKLEDLPTFKISEGNPIKINRNRLKVIYLEMLQSDQFIKKHQGIRNRSEKTDLLIHVEELNKAYSEKLKTEIGDGILDENNARIADPTYTNKIIVTLTNELQTLGVKASSKKVQDFINNIHTKLRELPTENAIALLDQYKTPEAVINHFSSEERQTLSSDDMMNLVLLSATISELNNAYHTMAELENRAKVSGRKLEITLPEKTATATTTSIPTMEQPEPTQSQSTSTSSTTTTPATKPTTVAAPKPSLESVKQELQAIEKRMNDENADCHRELQVLLSNKDTGAIIQSHKELVAFSQKLNSRSVKILSESLIALDKRLYEAIDPYEFVDYTLQKDKQKAAPHLYAMNAHFNKVSDFVKYDILSRTDLNERILALDYWIRIAMACRDNPTFKDANMIMAIASALENTSISRLASTFENLSPKAKENYKKLKELTSPNNNSQAIKDFSTKNPNSIPDMVNRTRVFDPINVTAGNNHAELQSFPIGYQELQIEHDRIEKIRKIKFTTNVSDQLSSDIENAGTEAKPLIPITESGKFNADNDFYQQSLKIEARGAEIQSSNFHKQKFYAKTEKLKKKKSRPTVIPATTDDAKYMVVSTVSESYPSLNKLIIAAGHTPAKTLDNIPENKVGIYLDTYAHGIFKNERDLTPSHQSALDQAPHNKVFAMLYLMLTDNQFFDENNIALAKKFIDQLAKEDSAKEYFTQYMTWLASNDLEEPKELKKHFIKVASDSGVNIKKIVKNAQPVVEKKPEPKVAAEEKPQVTETSKGQTTKAQTVTQPVLTPHPSPLLSQGLFKPTPPKASTTPTITMTLDVAANLDTMVDLLSDITRNIRQQLKLDAKATPQELAELKRKREASEPLPPLAPSTPKLR